MAFNFGGAGGFVDPNQFDFSVEEELESGLNTAELLRQIREEEAQREIEALQKGRKRDARSRAIGNIGAALPLIAAIIGADRGSDFQRAASNLSDLMFNIDQSRKQFREKEKGRQHQLDILQRELAGKKELQGERLEHQTELTDKEIASRESLQTERLTHESDLTDRQIESRENESQLDRDLRERLTKLQIDSSRANTMAGIQANKELQDTQFRRSVYEDLSRTMRPDKAMMLSEVIASGESTDNLEDGDKALLEFYTDVNKAITVSQKQKAVVDVLHKYASIPEPAIDPETGKELPVRMNPMTGQMEKPTVQRTNMLEAAIEIWGPEAGPEMLNFATTPIDPNEDVTSTGETVGEIKTQEQIGQVVNRLAAQPDIQANARGINSKESAELFAQALLEETGGDFQVAKAVSDSIKFSNSIYREQIKRYLDEVRRVQAQQALTEKIESGSLFQEERPFMGGPG